MPKLIEFKPTATVVPQLIERRKAAPAEVVVSIHRIKGSPIVIESVREQIVRAWDRGVDSRQLAKQYGVGRLDVERIIHHARNQFGRRAA